MGAAADARITLPDDSGNGGPDVLVRQVGTDHFHVVGRRSKENVLGRYHFVMAANQAVQAAAQNGTTTAFACLEVPTGATVKARLRRLELTFTHNQATPADHASAPRIALARATFTGTASDTAVTVAEVDPPVDATNVANWRAGLTGMTVSLGGLVWATLVPTTLLTTSGLIFPVYRAEFAPDDEDEFPVLVALDALVLYQPDNGTASDARVFSVCGYWDEIDAS